MPYIPKINGYSLTDLHDFEECKFRFYVRHHLDKKYQIATGSEQMALGVLLDRAIKEIHRNRDKGSYNAPLERLVKSIKYARDLIIKEEREAKSRPNFNTAVVDYFSEPVIELAENLFKNYYIRINGKFKQAVIDVDFCKWYLKVGNRDYVLWGGPDTIEMGDDGIPEVIDYKSRQNIVRGKETMDMVLMPKMYLLLTMNQLKRLGFKKARFKVLFWQDPLDNSFSEEFELDSADSLQEIFSQKISLINDNKTVDYCAGKYCDACNSPLRSEFVTEIQKLGLFFAPGDILLAAAQNASESSGILE